MRRFSQRSALVTLSEINITPLLDLAFVLLIIFVITTPLLEQGLSLKLPAGGKPDRPIERRDIRTVEVSSQGALMLDRRRLSLDQIEAALVRDFRANPNLVVYLRADENCRWREVEAVMDRCQRNGITRLSARTETPKR
ncbi:MAG TPA: biopolymer transporter ExbD [Candidatus Paceibacterota bacterium]|nr:biopolymer transporter ExbD [Verrucomicrobiota bacterium]HSA12915.1 biopolymer transporter ExbD [Candidatus Paceibacterota bacterium]